MHWLISSFPELDHLEPEQRAHVLRKVPWWTYPLIIVRAVIPSLLVSVIAGAWLADALRARSVAFVAVPLAAVLAPALYGFQLARVRVAMRRTIADGFRGDRVPFCFACGYDLRASAAPRCPECGTPLGSEAAK